jgi:P4 family phage/plasmid primase-like protien
MSYDKDISINDFIFKFKTTQGKPFTHTSISKPRHSYYISNDKNNTRKFLSLYKKAFIQGIPLSLCEKHIDIAPILIDLDFEKITSNIKKYEKSDELIPESKSFTKHIYKINSIETFINYYIDELIPYINTNELSYIDIYVQEKQYAVNIITHKIDNGQKQITTKIKDGVHIVIPDIVTCPELQFILRSKFIEKYGNFFNKLGLSKNMNDIFDESVIKRNNWLMYGSSKRLDDYDQVYYVTNIYKYDISAKKLYKVQNDELLNIEYKFNSKNITHKNNNDKDDKDDCDSNYETNDVELSSNSSITSIDTPEDVKIKNLEKFKEQSFRKKHSHFIELFSIRNKFKEIEYNPEKFIEIKEYINKIKERENKKILGCKPQISEFEKDIVTPDFEYVKNLIKILSPERASNYQTWIDVCWCLRNIDHRTYDDFLEFSKKSTRGNFDESACYKMWSSSKKDGFGIGSLIHWAKEDDFKAYQRIIGSKIFKELNNEHEIAEDDHSIARVIHNYLGPRFIAYYENSGKVKWFEFKNHRWHPDNGNASLSMIMSEEVVNLYKQYGTKFYEEDNHNMADLCKKIIKMLKNSTPKGRFIKELGSFYSDATNKLVHKFDTNTMLFGFENGVFDFNSESFGFRDGRPDDNMTYSCGYDYRYIPFDEYEYENNDHNYEYNEDQQIISEIMDFFDKVFPVRSVRDYMLMSFAECLTGETSEVFYICQGCGSNGKSLIFNIMKEVFGKYYASFPIQNLLGKRVSAGTANPDVVDTKGARIVAASEPENNEKLSSGFVKELTGGDPIKARALYSDPVEFKPQFKLFMIVNHLPTITDDSEGIWRRVKVVDFISQFKENPDDTEKYEFQMDRSLGERAKKWKLHLFNILVYYYKKLKKYGKKIPKEIEKANSEYKKNNNVFANYQSDVLIKTNNNKDILYLDDLYSEYNIWFKKYNTGHFAKLHKPDFIKTVEKVFGHISGKNGVSGGHIKGWKFKKDIEIPKKINDDDSDDSGDNNDSDDNNNSDNDDDNNSVYSYLNKDFNNNIINNTNLITINHISNLNKDDNNEDNKEDENDEEDEDNEEDNEEDNNDDEEVDEDDEDNEDNEDDEESEESEEDDEESVEDDDDDEDVEISDRD